MAATRIPKARPVTVRRARPEDAPAVAAIHVAAWHETYTGLLPPEMITALTYEARLAWWAQILSSPPATPGGAAFLAERGGEAVGFGTCNAQRSDLLAAAGYDGEISGLYVLRAAQGQGVGSALTTALATQLQKAGYAAAGSWVLQGNALGRRYCEVLGGTRVEAAVRGQGRLAEVAYGWRDLAPLAAAGDRGRRRGRGGRSAKTRTRDDG
ncbi:N-acetyltransferase family protein [Methylobacterium sp. P5_C11]